MVDVDVDVVDDVVLLVAALMASVARAAAKMKYAVAAEEDGECEEEDNDGTPKKQPTARIVDNSTGAPGDDSSRSSGRLFIFYLFCFAVF